MDVKVCVRVCLCESYVLMCMCVSVWVPVWGASECVYVYITLYVNLWVYMSVCLWEYICEGDSESMYMSVCVPVYECVPVCGCVSVCECVPVCEFVPTCVWVCMSVWVYVSGCMHVTICGSMCVELKVYVSGCVWLCVCFNVFDSFWPDRRSDISWNCCHYQTSFQSDVGGLSFSLPPVRFFAGWHQQLSPPSKNTTPPHSCVSTEEDGELNNVPALRKHTQAGLSALRNRAGESSLFLLKLTSLEMESENEPLFVFLGVWPFQVGLSLLCLLTP